METDDLSLLPKDGFSLLFVALARTRGPKGYSDEDRKILLKWSNDILSTMDELNDVLAGKRSISIDDGKVSTELISTFVGANTSRLRKIKNQQSFSQKAQRDDGDVESELALSPRERLLLADKYVLRAKPGSLYATALKVLDQETKLAVQDPVFDQYSTGGLPAAELIDKVGVEYERFSSHVEHEPEYSKFMTRVEFLAAGGSQRATAKAQRSHDIRLREAIFILRQSCASSRANTRNSFRLRSADLVFYKAFFPEKGKSLVFLIDVKHENELLRAFKELGAMNYEVSVNGTCGPRASANIRRLGRKAR